MIDKSDIKQWLESNGYYASDDNEMSIEMIGQCFNDLSPKWVSVFPSWPEPNQKVRAIIEHCKTGETKEIELDVVDEGDHLFKYEGCELSVAWDVIKWMPLPEPPK